MPDELHTGQTPFCPLQSPVHSMPGGGGTGDEVRASISCVDCINALFFCMSPAHQFDRYYKVRGGRAAR